MKGLDRMEIEFFAVSGVVGFALLFGVLWLLG
jgi:hypothetical protein